MPEAVASHSIPMPEGQPSATTDLERFRQTVCELDALTLMLSAVLDQGGGFHPDISYGIGGLFRGLTDDFRELYEEAVADVALIKTLPDYYDRVRARLFPQEAGQ